MNCPFCRRDIPRKMVESHLASLHGRVKSERKTESARANGLRPCAPGKKRGRPRTSNSDANKIITES